jgi:hypothetical protein
VLLARSGALPHQTKAAVEVHVGVSRNA